MVSRLKRRSQIVEAAALVFIEKGFHGATINDIADAAGLPRGSIHYHISSKQDLLFNVLADAVQGTIIKLEALDVRDGRPDELLHRIIEITIESHATRFLIFGTELLPEQLKQLRRLRQRWEKVIGLVVARGIEEGIFAPVDIPFVVFTIGAITTTWTRAYQERHRLSREDIAERCFEFVFRGIGAGPCPPTGAPSEPSRARTDHPVRL